KRQQFLFRRKRGGRCAPFRSEWLGKCYNVTFWGHISLTVWVAATAWGDAATAENGTRIVKDEMQKTGRARVLGLSAGPFIACLAVALLIAPGVSAQTAGQ